MTKEKTTSQSPEEMAKAAQEAAVKAAMEQAQSMFGNIPGFQMPEGIQVFPIWLKFKHSRRQC